MPVDASGRIMSKTVSAALGAGAAAAYFKPDILTGTARDIALGNFPNFSVSAPGGSNADTEALRKMVRRDTGPILGVAQSPWPGCRAGADVHSGGLRAGGTAFQ